VNRDRGTPAAAQGGAPGAGGGGGGSLDVAMLEQLAQSPQMQQLRQVSWVLPFIRDSANKQMVQENPALIQPLMQQIATSNPQLAQLINQNPQALYDLLGGGAGGEEGEEDFLGAQVMHVDLTEAEAAAVERVSHFRPAVRWAGCQFLLGQTLINSSRLSDSNDKWFYRLTCSVTRTKN
jgi:UV excision repair protein RAD23